MSSATDALHITKQFTSLWLIGGNDCDRNFNPFSSTVQTSVDLRVKGGAEIHKNLCVTGNVYAETSVSTPILYVELITNKNSSPDILIAPEGNVDIVPEMGQTNICSLLNIKGDVDITGNLDLEGNFYIDGELEIDGNVDIEGNLIVDGEVEIDGNVDIEGNLCIDGEVKVDGNVDIEGDFIVDGEVDIDGNVDIEGNLLVNGEVEINGNLFVDGEVEVDGNVDIEGNLCVEGEVKVDGNVDILGNVVIDGEIEINGNLNIDGNIDMNCNDISNLNAIFVENIYGKSPIQVHDNFNINGEIGGNGGRITWDEGIQIGDVTTIASNVTSLSIGKGATVTGEYGVAIGGNAIVSAPYCVQLGESIDSGTDASLKFRSQIVSDENWIGEGTTVAIIDDSGNIARGNTQVARITSIYDTSLTSSNATMNTVNTSQSWLSLDSVSPGGVWRISEDGFYIWQTEISHDDDGPTIQYLQWDESGNTGAVNVVLNSNQKGSAHGSFVRSSDDYFIGGNTNVDIVGNSTVTTVTISITKVF